MKFKLVTTIFFFTLVLNLSAQYRQKFIEGNLLVLEKNYSQALKNFQEAYQIDSLNSNINFKVGLCYLHITNEKYKARPYLERAVKAVVKRYDDINTQEKRAPIQAYFLLGQAYHLEYKFDSAVANYERYKALINKRDIASIKEADRFIEIAQNAKELIANPVNVRITNMGDSINSEYPDYSPALAASEAMAIFTSRRNTSTGGDRTEDGGYFEDIVVSYKKGNGSWTQAKPISPRINSYGHEASISLTPDGQQLFIYKDDGKNGGDIYVSRLEGEEWGFPEKLGSDINTKYQEPSVCLSAYGDVLYFVSDRPGGMGGLDIYRCVKLPNGKWSLATNLGPPVNTPYDEDAPFMHPDGITLYFSSKGHKNMGGYDIFSTQFVDGMGWVEPTNVGYPVNTPDDDVCYVVSPDAKRAYFSSDRDGTKGGKDIYQLSFPDAESRALTLIKGVISPAVGAELPADLAIVVTNIETGMEEGTFKPIRRNGSFAIIIPPNNRYHFSYIANGAEFYQEDIAVPEGSEYNEIYKALSLQPIVIGGVAPKAEEKEEVKVESDLVTVNEKLLDAGGKPVKAAKIVVYDHKSGQIIADKLSIDDKGVFTYNTQNGKKVEVSIEYQGKLLNEIYLVSTKKDSKNFDKQTNVNTLKSNNLNIKVSSFPNQAWKMGDYYYEIELSVPTLTSDVTNSGGLVLCYFSPDGTSWTSLPSESPMPINVSSSIKSVTLKFLQQTEKAPDNISVKVLVVGSSLPKGMDVSDYNQVKQFFKIPD